ncbi:MAG: urease accessory protein UreD [Gemmataceae bacterium]
MGAPATRITAADFLTPPELKPWRLAPDGAGRIGGVRLELIKEARETRLGRLYQQVPLRLLPPFQFSAQEPALLYLLNPTAGLMDGDGQLIELTAGPGTQTVVVGQSATRIHPSIKGYATQQWSIQVGDNAVLVVLPGPAIPFQGCRYFQRIAVSLAPTAHLMWGDIWFAGRYARGKDSEMFQFGDVIQDLTIRRADRLVFRDRFHWHGPWDKATARWHFGDALACGSLFVTGTVDEEIGSSAALFSTACGDSCLRWQGASEAVTAAVVQTALRLAGLKSACAERRPWLSSKDLAPCHWFS